MISTSTVKLKELSQCQAFLTVLLLAHIDTDISVILLIWIYGNIDWQFQRLTPQAVPHAVASLKSGKSPGPNYLVAEHLKHADPSVNVLLSILTNNCLIHAFFPAGLMETVIIPIVSTTLYVTSRN